jgi:hypothetical protein
VEFTTANPPLKYAFLENVFAHIVSQEAYVSRRVIALSTINLAQLMLIARPAGYIHARMELVYLFSHEKWSKSMIFIANSLFKFIILNIYIHLTQTI